MICRGKGSASGFLPLNAVLILNPTAYANTIMFFVSKKVSRIFRYLAGSLSAAEQNDYGFSISLTSIRANPGRRSRFHPGQAAWRILFADSETGAHEKNYHNSSAVSRV